MLEWEKAVVAVVEVHVVDSVSVEDEVVLPLVVMAVGTGLEVTVREVMVAVQDTENGENKLGVVDMGDMVVDTEDINHLIWSHSGSLSPSPVV